MRKILLPCVFTILLTVKLAGQSGTFQDSLLDKMTGHWVLSGTIDGASTIHDVEINWILGHQYLQIEEVSREKQSDGQAIYEAKVLIGKDSVTGGYTCQWLDNTGGSGLNQDAFGHALRIGDTIPFLFKGSDGSIFKTRFIYHQDSDSWQWQMDGEEKGTIKPFARVVLTRK